MTVRTRIKICGITRPGDLEAAVEAGADAIGLVLWPKSPRAVDLVQAAALARRLPPFVTPVGLFVNATPAEVRAACEAVPNLVLQFHGDETAEACDAPGRPYLRAARMSPGFDLLDFARRFPGAEGLVLDAFVEGYGGGGKVFDWSLIPPSVPAPVVLSGGLYPANVVDAVLSVRPWAVVVSTRVEEAKGLKDAVLMRQFCAAVREADARRQDAEEGL
jgi:phosphoribosylanthranilate isomerase